MFDEFECGDCDKVICAGTRRRVNRSEVDGMKKGADSTGEVIYI